MKIGVNTSIKAISSFNFILIFSYLVLLIAQTLQDEYVFSDSTYFIAISFFTNMILYCLYTTRKHLDLLFLAVSFLSLLASWLGCLLIGIELIEFAGANKQLVTFMYVVIVSFIIMQVFERTKETNYSYCLKVKRFEINEFVFYPRSDFKSEVKTIATRSIAKKLNKYIIFILNIISAAYGLMIAENSVFLS